MPSEQAPLIFFLPAADAQALETAEALASESPADGATPIETEYVLRRLTGNRGFTRLKINLPRFSLDNPRREVSMEGMAYDTHLRVGFYGNFEVLAAPLFKALRSLGLTWYSVWDKKILNAWPKFKEPQIDSSFGARMTRVMQRETARLRETEPDERRRTALLNAFIRSPEFKAQMAQEARNESTPARRGRKKTYSDYVDCYARWTTGRPSAAELAALRKVNPKSAAMSLAELRQSIGDSPRLKFLTGIPPSRAANLIRAAAKEGLIVETEPAS
jgi:hypothetical protein